LVARATDRAVSEPAGIETDDLLSSQRTLIETTKSDLLKAAAKSGSQ